MSNNHPNRNWRRKWEVVNDENGVSFIHVSGMLIVPDVEQKLYVMCGSRDDDLLNHITLDKARKLATLLKEANELWSEQNGKK